MKRANDSQVVAHDEEIADLLASCRSTVCSVVEVQMPMVCAFAVDGSKHNGSGDQTERRIHEERAPDAFLES